MKLPIVLHTPSGDMRKLWEAHGQAIYGVDSGYLLMPDRERPWPLKEAVAFASWDDAYFCLMGEHWHEPDA
ncbi:MAG TPA: hypothetical protein VJW94_10230 [Candidatus Acidoferrum sp.]|nr:hypothetical protein [Candidatus Acidoferrum sp.]